MAVDVEEEVVVEVAVAALHLPQRAQRAARAQERDDAAASHEKDAKHGLLVQKKPPQYPQDGLKFAIAGTGAMGLEHIRNISLLRERGSTIVAVADSDARAR